MAPEQAYAVILDGRRVDQPARPTATTVRYLALLESGTHTLELAYRDPVTGQLGEIRTVTLTVE